MSGRVERYVKASTYSAKKQETAIDDPDLRRIILAALPQMADLPAEEIVWPELKISDVRVTAADAAAKTDLVIDELRSAIELRDLTDPSQD
jgi:hypothetical protein